jgi:hypothetical protein
VLAGFWLTVCAGLAVVVTYQLATSFLSPPTVTTAPPGTPLLDPVEQPAPPRSPAADAVEQITARPLFSERRRPYVPLSALAEEKTAEPTQPSLSLELAGTFLTDTDQAALLLVADGSPAWLRRGQLIEGWRVEAIERDRVQLRKDGQQQVLQLRADIPVPEKTTILGQAAGDDATARGLDSESVDEEAAPPE